MAERFRARAVTHPGTVRRHNEDVYVDRPEIGLWAVAEPRLASTDSVRSALLLVERGEVPAGVVYATDAAVAPGVAVAGTFPENTHDPIVYPFAVTRAGDTAAARAFLTYLAGPEAGAIFAKRGFKTE